MLARRSQEQGPLRIRQPISHPASPSLQSSQDPLSALPGSTGHDRCQLPQRRGDATTCDTGTGGMAETARWPNQPQKATRPIQPQSRQIQPGGRFSPNQGRSSPSDWKGSRIQIRLGQSWMRMCVVVVVVVVVVVAVAVDVVVAFDVLLSLLLVLCGSWLVGWGGGRGFCCAGGLPLRHH